MQSCSENRTLLSEIAGGRAMVGIDSEDLLDIASLTLQQGAAERPAPAHVATNATPATPASVQLSVPPRYEDLQVLIPNLQQSVIELSRTLAPRGFSYKSAAPQGNFAVAIFSRRPTAAEASGLARYERVETILRNNTERFVQIGDEMRGRGRGWSCDGYRLEQGMLVAKFRRRLAGPEVRPQGMAANSAAPAAAASTTPANTPPQLASHSRRSRGSFIKRLFT